MHLTVQLYVHLSILTIYMYLTLFMLQLYASYT